VSTSASLSLVLYVPGCTEAPLHFYTKQGQPVPTNAIISARWGGIVVLNPPKYACKEDEATEMEVPTERVLGIFIAQLRQLLGIPDLVPNIKRAPRFVLMVMRKIAEADSIC
jgi:hypothetical protein